MLFVAPALEKRGTKVAFALCLGLDQHMWLAQCDEFYKQTSSKMAVSPVRTNASKILNVSKYPKYGRFLFLWFVQKFNNAFLSYLVIGVKHAGLEGILGTNIQYQDIGDVL